MTPNSPPPAANRVRALGAVLAAAYLSLCLALTAHAPASWNDVARIAAIESLAERGTWSISDSPWFEQTQDKVLLNGRFVSDKMPLLTWAAAGPYAIARGLTGASLAPDCGLTAPCAYAFLTLLVCGLPAALLIWLFFDLAVFLGRGTIAAAFGALALGIATEVLPYSLVLNHHLPAAVSLFAAFYLLLTRAPRQDRWLVGVGFLLGLAVCFDPLAGIGVVALVLLSALRHGQRALLLLPGLFPPLALTALLDLQITGTIVPAYLIPGGYDYPGSAFPPTIAGNGTPDNLPQYAFRMFLGAQGLYAYNPILLLAWLGLALVLFSRRHPLRLAALVIGGAFLALSFYLVTSTGNYGGLAYGERWFLSALPLLMLFILFVPPLQSARAFLARSAFPSNRGAPLLSLVASALLLGAFALSLISSVQGSRTPWDYVSPPVHLTRDPTTGALGLRSNLRWP